MKQIDYNDITIRFSEEVCHIFIEGAPLLKVVPSEEEGHVEIIYANASNPRKRKMPCVEAILHIFMKHRIHPHVLTPIIETIARDESRAFRRGDYLLGRAGEIFG